MTDLYTQIDIAEINDDNLGTFLSDLRAAGVTVLLLSGIDLFDEGETHTRTLAHIADMIRFFKSEGFRVAFWTNTLGYGTERSAAFEARFAGSLRLTSFSGGTCSAICTTDKLFLAACCDLTRDLIRAGADMILWDDDLVQSVRPGFTCVCPGHLALMRARTGRNLTPDQLRDSFTGAPNLLRTTFMDVMGESMTDFCRALRAAADEVDPTVPMGLCASYTHFDLEGVELSELLRVLAGKGKPFLRISGAPYWPVIAPRYPEQDLGGVTEFCRMQIGWLREADDPDLTVIDENDPYPRDHTVVPEVLCELYDAVLTANGGADRHKYMLCYGPDRHDTAYLDIHVRNTPDWRVLAAMFAGREPVGFRVCHPMHMIRSADLPTPYCGDSRLMGQFSHPMAGIFLSLFGLPTRYEGTAPGIAFGADALGLMPAQMKAGVLLDVPAARILQARGIDVGPVPAAGDSFRPAAYVSPDGRFAVLPFDGAVLSYARTEAGPACLPDGQAQLAAVYEVLSGQSPDARVVGSHGVYLITARNVPDDGTLALLLCNMLPTEAENVTVRLSAPAQITAALRCSPSLSGDTLTLPMLGGYDFAAVTVKDV
ncbi:MAG: hypothetical protein MJ192_04105 [Clostridia bacterium]|nr:hypothetical protein [Clostridia bacterium]